jgi:hypothetical protein
MAESHSRRLPREGRGTGMDRVHTRRRRCAQLIAPRRCASLWGSFSGGGSARLPRRAGVTCSRAWLFGATKSPGAILNSRRLARRAEGRMPGVRCHGSG